MAAFLKDLVNDFDGVWLVQVFLMTLCLYQMFIMQRLAMSKAGTRVQALALVQLLKR